MALNLKKVKRKSITLILYFYMPKHSKASITMQFFQYYSKKYLKMFCPSIVMQFPRQID